MTEVAAREATRLSTSLGTMMLENGEVDGLFLVLFTLQRTRSFLRSKSSRLHQMLLSYLLYSSC
ncbi:hypothetical protein OH492_07030 [Vibrio chagasii]|nr:hypothetical protein [Vibrio chagasii]